MGIGLEVYAPNGSLISNTETRALKVLGSFTTSSAVMNGTIPNPAFALGTPWWVVKTPVDAVGGWSLTVRQRDATTLEWFITTYAFGAVAGSPTFVVLYGIR